MKLFEETMQMGTFTENLKEIQNFFWLFNPKISSRELAKFIDKTKIIPLTHIGLHNQNSEPLQNKNELIFYYKALINSIDSVLSGRYEDFDAHTTSTCCHGISLFVRNIILETIKLNLHAIKKEACTRLENVESIKEILSIPESLITLTQLYICTYIKEEDPKKERRAITKTRRLQELASISTNFCNKIAHDLQKYFSNTIAILYHSLLKKLPTGMKINQIPINIWGQYVQPDQLRTDKRGVKYASCMFSMQISLAHLIKSKAKIAIVNDLTDLNGELVNRYVCLLEGDGIGNFKSVSLEKNHDELRLHEPVIVFGGCAYRDTSDFNAISQEMEIWKTLFPSLVLACDIHYPQFPTINDDPQFHCEPITPNDKCLIDSIKRHSTIKGVSAVDPTLFCLTHIYPTSLINIIKALEGNNEILPISFIPATRLLFQTNQNKLEKAS